MALENREASIGPAGSSCGSSEDRFRLLLHARTCKLAREGSTGGTCAGQLVERGATACPVKDRAGRRGSCARLDRFQADVKPPTGDSDDATMVNYPRIMTFS